MTLTEAQRLAFLKGREKRKANLEKKKLEEAEKEMFAKMDEDKPVSTEEPLIEPPPPKPKVKRTKTIRPKQEPVEVKIQPDPEPESKPVTTESVEPPIEEAKAAPVSQPTRQSLFNEDEFADKIVSMLLSKGVGVPSSEKPVRAKPASVKPKKAKPIETAPTPPTSTFSWL